MKIAMIVLNYNDFETTKKLVSKVQEYLSIEKIIIVDNHSSDNSYEELKKIENEKVEVIQTKANLGYAYGNNVGVEYAMDRYNPMYCIIANPDISFEENIVEPIIEEFNRDEKIAIVTAKMQGNINAWKLPTWVKTIKSMFLLWNHFSKKYERLEKTSNEVDVVSGSFFVIKSKAFLKVGKFDERTFLYEEENILAYKLKQNGYKTIILTNIEYEHHHSMTVKKQYKSKIKPFKIYVESIRIYLNYYLKINLLQNLLFNICYCIALIERFLYDCVMRIKYKGVKSKK